LLVFAGLLYRAADLQISKGGFLIKQGEARFARYRESGASRARIYDRSGLLLSASVQRALVWVNPKEFILSGDPRINDVAALLNLPTAEIQEKAKSRLDREFVPLKHHVDIALAQHIRELHVPGVYFIYEPLRVYPAPFDTFSVLGVVNSQGEGISGIELMLNKSLIRKSHRRYLTIDRRGAIADVRSEVESDDSTTVRDATLTLDARLQVLSGAVVSELANRTHAGSVDLVLVDSATGELLAAVQQAAEGEPRPGVGVTPIVSRTFEPGFTLAPFIIAAGLEHKAFDVADRMPTAVPALISVLEQPETRTAVLVSDILARRSKSAITTAGMNLRQNDLWSTLDGIGIGHSTSLGIPGEREGGPSFPLPWRATDQALIASGRRVQMTLPQLARAYSVLAAGGLIYPLTVLLEKNASADGRDERIFETHTTKQVLAMLRATSESAGKKSEVASAYPATCDSYEIIVVRLGVTQKRRQAVAAAISLGNGRIVGAIRLEVPYVSGEDTGLVARAALVKLLQTADKLFQEQMTLSDSQISK